LCGNGVVDAGEECDAGKDNGKISSSCDIECKKIVVSNQETSNPTPTNGHATQNAAPASAGCSMANANQVSGNISAVLAIMLTMALLLVTRFRKDLTRIF
jgi:hypothetical protein